MKRQNGFTLIELVMVIVILGVLAAVAMPKFIDLKSDAERASVAGVAGAAASASAINYAGCSLTNHSTAGANATKCAKVFSCDSIKAALQGGTWPSTLYSGAIAAGGTELTGVVADNSVTKSCVLTYATTPAVTAAYTIIGAGNP